MIEIAIMATSFASKDNEKSPRKILSKKFHFRAKKDKRSAKMKSFTPFFQKNNNRILEFYVVKKPPQGRRTAVRGRRRGVLIMLYCSKIFL